MRYINLDQASTSFPKPKEVAEAMCHFLQECAVSINRSSSSMAYGVEEMVFDARAEVAEFFNAPNAQNVAFTKNITESLNIAIQGLFKNGDHVLCSGLEHNAVMRPLELMKSQGVNYTCLRHDKEGHIIKESLLEILKPNTKALIATHASNVCGTVLPLMELGEFCRNHKLWFVVDSAQTAGILPIDMQKFNIDVLCFTGHKALYAPQGIGGIILSDELAKHIRPLIYGGTGSKSDLLTMPKLMPDKLEAGTPNLPAIAGLLSALRWIKKEGIDRIYAHDMKLTALFLEGLKRLNIDIVGTDDTTSRVAVVSVMLPNCAEIAQTLQERFGIATRVGLHCAPLAHQTLGTFPYGTIRFSFSYFNTERDVHDTLKALEEILWKLEN